MATVVNIPQGSYQEPGEAAGTAIGGMLGRLFGADMQKREEERKAAQVQAVLEKIEKAGSREKAIEIISQPGVLPFTDPKDITTALGWVREVYPDAPKAEFDTVTGYSRTGDEVKRQVNKQDIPALQADPNRQENLFGPGVSLTKPGDIEELFKLGPDGTAMSQGKNRIGNRLPGEYTLKELERIDAKKAADAKSRAEDRSVAAAERGAAAQERANLAVDLQVQRTANGFLADALHIKKSLGVDGMFDIDLSGEQPEKVKQFLAARELLPALLEKHKGNAMKAVNEVVTKLGIGKGKSPEDTPKPAPAPAPKDGVKEAVGLVAPTEVRSRFEADEQMKKMNAKLGKKVTLNGKTKWEVISNGKVVGYWN